MCGFWQHIQNINPKAGAAASQYDWSEEFLNEMVEEPPLTQGAEEGECAATQRHDPPPPPPAPIDEAIDDYHTRIPPACLSSWHASLRSFASALTALDMVPFGTACTGTDIFAKVMEKLFLYWRQMFGLQIGHLQAVLHSEKSVQKQQFLAVASFTNQFLTGMHKAITMFEVSLKAHKQLENNFPKRTEWRWFPLH